MPNLEDIITQARKTLSCPVCGRKFELHEIKLRGILDSAYVIQTICDNGHPLLVTVFIATSRADGTSTFVLQKNQIPKTRITSNDVIDSHEQIEKFDGNFIGLWDK